MMAKKMVLIDPSSLLLKDYPLPNPLSESFLQIDTDIKRILDTKNMSEHEKALAYQQALRSYLIKSNQLMSQKQESPPQPAQVLNTPLNNDELTIQSNIENQAIDSLPKTLRDKGRLVLDHIKKATDVK